MATNITPSDDRAFHFRLEILIIYGGTVVLRNIFDQKVQLQNVPLNVLLANEKTLISRLRGQKAITTTQYHMLYPPGGQQPNIVAFDLSLITCLLRNLPSLGLNPNYSWNALPQPADCSLEADLYRVKSFRNEIAHTSSTTGLERTAFERKWTEVEQVLLRLNSSVPNPVPNLKQTFDSYKMEAIIDSDDIDFTTLREYEKAIKDGKEEDRKIRLMIIGCYEQGKTTLARRLLGQTLERIESTNGIDIHKVACTQEGQKWERIEKDDILHESMERLASIPEVQNVETLTESNQDQSLLVTNRLQAAVRTEVTDETENESSLRDDELTSFFPNRISPVKRNDVMVYQKIKRELREKEHEEKQILSLWDFGGQFVFYSTHHCSIQCMLFICSYLTCKKVLNRKSLTRTTQAVHVHL